MLTVNSPLFAAIEKAGNGKNVAHGFCMAIEDRHGGKLYYYRKRRVGIRVVSEYAGSGVVAQIEEHLARKREYEKQSERRRLEAARLLTADIDSQIDSVCDLIDLMVKGHLLASGYHSHKGQWRKKRR